MLLHWTVNITWRSPTQDLLTLHDTLLHWICSHYMTPSYTGSAHIIWHPPTLDLFTLYDTLLHWICSHYMTPSYTGSAHIIWHPPTLDLLTLYDTLLHWICSHYNAVTQDLLTLYDFATLDLLTLRSCYTRPAQCYTGSAHIIRRTATLDLLFNYCATLDPLTLDDALLHWICLHYDAVSLDLITLHDCFTGSVHITWLLQWICSHYRTLYHTGSAHIAWCSATLDLLTLHDIIHWMFTWCSWYTGSVHITPSHWICSHYTTWHSATLQQNCRPSWPSSPVTACPHWTASPTTDPIVLGTEQGHH